MASSLPRRLRRAAIAGFAAVFILGLGALAAHAILLSGSGEEATAEASYLPVDAEQVSRTEGYTVTRSFTGRVVARRISDLAFEHGGLVQTVLVDDGARVAAGDVLAVLGQRELEAERAQLAAQRAEIAANLALAERTAARQASLAAQGHTSQQALDDARFQQSALAAERDAVDAALDANQVRLDQSRLLAPFAGVVTGRAVDEGAVVDAGRPIVRLVETASPEVRVGVPAGIAARLGLGDRQTVVIDGAPHTARIAAILPDLAMDTRTVTVVLAVDDAVDAPSGDLALLQIEDPVEGAGHWVPLTALVEGTRGLWTVYVLTPVDPTDRGLPAPGYPVFEVRAAAVEVVHPETDRVFVRGTLPATATIVADGTHRLVAGQLVRLSPADAALGPQIAANR
ncbi:MAG: efflux RND transporter periplasmic adaptor subunit [Rhodospirillaceae bacterium]|nr:efflux RND transporter periplasmic adaptor subunit [Rhodospirillaceae bacterium]